MALGGAMAHVASPARSDSEGHCFQEPRFDRGERTVVGW